MLIELRIYHVLPGRMPALLNRFVQVTLPLWERHGIRQIGFFTDEIGSSNHKLTYMLQWDSLAEREARWPSFITDPEWLEKRAQSELDGPIVSHIDNSILTPTAFSALR